MTWWVGSKKMLLRELLLNYFGLSLVDLRYKALELKGKGKNCHCFSDKATQRVLKSLNFA